MDGNLENEILLTWRDGGIQRKKLQRAAADSETDLSYALRRCHPDMAIQYAFNSSVPLHGNVELELFWGIPGLFFCHNCPVKSRYYAPLLFSSGKRSNLLDVWPLPALFKLNLIGGKWIVFLSVRGTRQQLNSNIVDFSFLAKVKSPTRQRRSGLARWKAECLQGESTYLQA